MMLITVLAKLSHLLAIFQFYWRNPIILPQTHQPKKKAPATTMVTGTFHPPIYSKSIMVTGTSQLLEVILFYFPLFLTLFADLSIDKCCSSAKQSRNSRNGSCEENFVF